MEPKTLHVKLHKANKAITPDFSESYLRNAEVAIKAVELCLNKTSNSISYNL